MPDHYYISVKAVDVGVSVGVNGAPLLQDLKGLGLAADLCVNAWIKPANNRLTVTLIWPMDPKNPRPYKPGVARCQVQMFIADAASQAPKPGKMLAEFQWPIPGVPEAYPHVSISPLHIVGGPRTLLWAEAQPIKEIEPHDKEQIVALIAKFRQAILAKDAEAAFKLMEYRYGDEARAEGKPFERVKDAIIKQYQWLFKQGEWKATPLPLALATFMKAADDQVVLVRRGALDDAITLENTDPDNPNMIGFEIYVAKLHERWTLAR